MVSGNVENATDKEPSPAPISAGAGQEEEVIIARPPKAVTMWTVLIGAVLLILAFQMHDGAPIYNFFVETDATGIGANVAVDGKQIGTIGLLDEGGLKVNGVRAFVPSGKHQLSISKNGFKPFSKDFVLNGEDYITLTLQSQNQAATPPSKGQTIQLPGPSSSSSADPKDGQTIQLPGPSK